MTYYSSPKITDWQKQIIMGTVLGGSSIVKPKKGRNSYLFMRSRDKEWLYYKANEMKNLCSERPFTTEGNTLRWHSNCYPIFNDLHEQLYVNGEKTIGMSILDSLRDIGLAIWYGDSGKTQKGRAIINTHKFKEKGTKIVAQYLKEVGIGDSDIVKERENCRLRLTTEATKSFFMIIAHQLPEFMQSKITI